MRTHTVTVAGSTFDLSWTQETAKRYLFRMGEIGGEPTDYSNPRTISSKLFKVLWALLPVAEFSKYDSPEDLFAAVDHEKEGEAIYTAINRIFEDRFPDAEKKSNGKKKPSQESS